MVSLLVRSGRDCHTVCASEKDWLSLLVGSGWDRSDRPWEWLGSVRPSVGVAGIGRVLVREWKGLVRLSVTLYNQ